MDFRPEDQRRESSTTRRETPKRYSDEAEQNRGEPRPPRMPEQPAGPAPAGMPASFPPGVGPGLGGSLPGEAAAPEVIGEELLHLRKGPGTIKVSEDEIAERMDAESPDGRPPTMRDRREARIFFWAGLVILPTAVIGIMAWYAGWLPAALAFVLMLGFILFAAWPTWHAALNRKQDTDKVKREVVAEHMPQSDAGRAEAMRQDLVPGQPMWRNEQ
jgi:hypothetical protein